MYQSPPSVLVWTRRQWIAAIGTALLGAALSLGLISLAHGDIESGLRGIAMGGVQSVISVWMSLRMRPRRPRRPAGARSQRAVLIICSGIVLVAAGKIGLDLIQGRPMDAAISTGLGAGSTVMGPLWIWGRHLKRVERSDAAR